MYSKERFSISNFTAQRTSNILIMVWQIYVISSNVKQR